MIAIDDIHQGYQLSEVNLSNRFKKARPEKWTRRAQIIHDHAKGPFCFKAVSSDHPCFTRSIGVRRRNIPVRETQLMLRARGRDKLDQLTAARMVVAY